MTLFSVEASDALSMLHWCQFIAKLRVIALLTIAMTHTANQLIYIQQIGGF